MPVWKESPTQSIDLDGPPSQVEPLIRPVDVVLFDAMLDQFAGLGGDTQRLAAQLETLPTFARRQSEFGWWATALNREPVEILLANASYDVLQSLGCSTLALATAEGPVLARNMDWFPERELAVASLRLELRRGSGPPIVLAGWLGSVGVVSGLSPRGFAIVLNAVSSQESPNMMGESVLLTIRDVLESARDFDEALARLTDTPLACSGLFTLVGHENAQRAVVERSPSQAAVRRPQGEEPLVATNHYLLLEEEPQPFASPAIAELARTACQRFKSLEARWSQHDSTTPVSDDALLESLSDPRVIQSITAQHVLFRPAQQSARVFVPRRLVDG